MSDGMSAPAYDLEAPVSGPAADLQALHTSAPSGDFQAPDMFGSADHHRALDTSALADDLQAADMYGPAGLQVLDMPIPLTILILLICLAPLTSFRLLVCLALLTVCATRRGLCYSFLVCATRGGLSYSAWSVLLDFVFLLDLVCVTRLAPRASTSRG